MLKPWGRREPKNPLIPMPFEALRDSNAADYRGKPTLVCPCGYDMFIMCARFDREDRTVSFYLLDGMCAMCGSMVTLPTEIDENGEE